MCTYILSLSFFLIEIFFFFLSPLYFRFLLTSHILNYCHYFIFMSISDSIFIVHSFCSCSKFSKCLHDERQNELHQGIRKQQDQPKLGTNIGTYISYIRPKEYFGELEYLINTYQLDIKHVRNNSK